MSNYSVPPRAPEGAPVGRGARPAFGMALSVLEWTDAADDADDVRDRGGEDVRGPEQEPELAWAVGQGRGGDAG